MPTPDHVSARATTARYAALRHMSVRDVIRIARANDFDAREREVIDLAIEADRRQAEGDSIRVGPGGREIHGACEILDHELRSLAHDMRTEARAHDEFCREAYGDEMGIDYERSW